MGVWARVKTWVAGETLTAADINAEFDNIINQVSIDKKTTGFSIAGGTTSKTLTVTADATFSGTTNIVGALDVATGTTTNIDADVTVAAELHVEAATHVNQDLTTDASPTHPTVKLTNLTDTYIPKHTDDATGLENSTMKITAAGEMTNASQPAFLVGSGTQDNIAIDSDITILFSSEVFDQNNDFNISTYTFTAPVAGKYPLNLLLNLSNVDTAAYYVISIITSNRTYYTLLDSRQLVADSLTYTIPMSMLCDMDAADTAFVRIHQYGGTQQTDIVDSFFSGFLAC